MRTFCQIIALGFYILGIIEMARGDIQGGTYCKASACFLLLAATTFFNEKKG